MLLLNQLNTKIFNKNNSSALEVYKQLRAGIMVEINMVNLEKSKIKTDRFAGKIVCIKRNGLLTRIELLIKTSTMSCIRTIYIHSPLITKIELI